MYRAFLLLLCFVGVASFSQINVVYAQTKKKTALKKSAPKKSKVKDPGQDATIAVDGAAIYEAQNFDAPVVDYFDRGKRVRVSNKVYQGTGGLGSFYKIRVRKGVYGFISDVDVEVSGKKNTVTRTARTDEGENVDPTVLQDDTGEPQENADIGGTVYMTRYIGFTYVSYNYSEVIGNKLYSAATPFYGLRISGPSNMVGGMPLDIELSVSPTVPDFYNRFAKDSSGFILSTQAMAMLPIIDTKKQSLYYGFGLMFRYSKYEVKLDSNPTAPPIPSEESALGGVLGVGYALGLGPSLCFRVDARYIVEKEKYPAYGASLQFRY
jgi:hypothetical protein